MKVVLLAGGLGTRISEETHLKPKPMVEIGGKPILWHIMKIYSHFGFNDFIICGGYKNYIIKEYFADYYLRNSDVTFNLRDNTFTVHSTNVEPWRVTVVDTGEQTMTGGRIKRVEKYIEEDTFMLTYGDGVADIDIHALLKLHRSNGTIATLTSSLPSGRFGALHIEDESHIVTSFKEKPSGEVGWVNAGFFVLQKDVFKYIEGDHTIFERDPLENLARDGQLSAYKHAGFWKPMDTLRDKTELEEMWNSNNAKWKIWE